MRSFLLDTNICSAIMRRQPNFAHRLTQYTGRVAISSITLAELYAGAYKRPSANKFLPLIDELLVELALLSFDGACAEQYGKLWGQLARGGITVPPADLMIASVALVHDLTLVTNNTADFRHVPNLRIVDWLGL